MTWIDPPLSAVRDVVARALAEDLGVLGDLTASLVPDDARAVAAVVARQAGVLAGRLCAVETFAAVDANLRVQWHLADGVDVHPGSVVAEVEGPLASMLTAERTALNLLGHLSGVATLTRRFVMAAQGRARIRDTRKTTPGLRALEKAAVRAGGGANHRGSLGEGILVKDNHLAGVSIPDAVARAHHRWPGQPVEVECDTLDQVQEALETGADEILLDNMDLESLRKAAALVREHGRRSEASGGVSLETVAAIAETGVDSISVGALTHSAPAIDLSLEIEN
jgi:nicotinate-nucleotide pyrophosphorylase (carboxylating)